ncbi:MAG: hypothetical protein IJG00_00315 [Clostridia bacterium]|nr:hypothetical protein [Clostridia bacterium]
MVTNINKMIEAVLEREDLMKELAKKETYDDVYDFCLSVEDGYTRDEFLDFLNSSQGEYDTDITELDKEMLSYVGGGVSVGAKALSAMKFYKNMKKGPTIFKPQNNDNIL